jgi:hypothetical protein
LIPLLWDLALLFTLATIIWGLVLVPFNAFNDHPIRSALIGLAFLWAALGICHWSDQLFGWLSRNRWMVLVLAIPPIIVLWSDGGWRSTFYLASYAPLALAVATTNLRWTLATAAVLAVGYCSGLAVNGYTWNELQALRDADSVIANAGGYLLAAFFVGIPLDFVRSSGGQLFRGESPWGRTLVDYLVGLAGAATLGVFGLLLAGQS